MKNVQNGKRSSDGICMSVSVWPNRVLLAILVIPFLNVCFLRGNFFLASFAPLCVNGDGGKCHSVVATASLS